MAAPTYLQNANTPQQQVDTLFPATTGSTPAGGYKNGRHPITDASGNVYLSHAVAPTPGTLTDRSGTITSGGTAQQAAAANAARVYFVIQNLDAAEDLWFNFGVTAVALQPSFKLGPGGSFVMESGFVSTELVSVIATTTGHKFACKEA